MNADVLELLRCAQVNFDNAERAHPTMKVFNPYYAIARTQLDEAIELAEKKD